MKNNTNGEGSIGNIRKKAEFLAFIGEIEKGAIANWIDIARALGVDKDTITEWKKLPEAQIAIKKGLSDALSSMEEVGRKDWRMWESKLKMLGLIPREKHELSGPEGKPIAILGGASVRGLHSDDSVSENQ
jgi:hypothetical protein